MDKGLNKLDVVALLADRLEGGLARGQVGTVIEQLSGDNLLVEFSDDQGRAYAVVACPREELDFALRPAGRVGVVGR